MKALFGTDGIRGEAGRFPLDHATVAKIGFSLSTYLKQSLDKQPVLVIGRDTRESGEWIEQEVINGARRAGAECHDAGVITTPGVAFLTRNLKADAGIVISASHNPYHDNGIKIFSASGEKIDDSIERLIEVDILRGSDESEQPVTLSDTPSISEPQELEERYLKFLADDIAHNLSLAGLKIVVDCANGASSHLAPQLFERLGAKTIAINAEPDGRNINLNCGSLHIDGLQKKVEAERADLGVAFDGDADRALFADANGSYVDGDATLWVLACYLKQRRRLNDNTVVATVMSNIGLEIALREEGIRLVRTDVGDKYVLDELLRLNASLGGEQSGHVILPALSLAGDGMITALCLLRAMQEAQKPLAQLTEGFQRYPQVLVNVSVKDKLPFSDLPTVSRTVAEVERKLAANGRLLLRYSGTEPLARIMIEGKNQAEIEELAERIAASIKAAIGL